MRGPKAPSWLRSYAIGVVIFILWVALGVATYQDGPNDVPLIVSLLAN